MIHVVGAYIQDNTSFLLAQRNKGELKGKWEFPGGKVEPNESEFQAIEREILEELAIKVRAIKHIHSFIHKYSFAEISLSLIACKALNDKPTFKTNGSHTSLCWVTLMDKKDLAPLDKKIFNYLKKNAVVLDTYKSK